MGAPDRDKTAAADDAAAVGPLLYVQILGWMRATNYRGEDVVPNAKAARAVLAYLCLADGAEVPRARLAAMLWDRAPEDVARTRLGPALRKLRAALGPIAGQLLFITQDMVRLDTALCWIDAVVMLAPEPSGPDSLRSDWMLLRAELLDGFDGLSTSFDQWLLTERTRFVDRLRKLMEAELAGIAQSGGDGRARAEIARRLIVFDPTNEGASRALMRAYSDMGERVMAVREYARCRDALKFSLDAEPSRETEALHQAVRTFGSRPVTGRDKSASKEPPQQKARPQRRPKYQPKPKPRSARPRVGVLPFLTTRSPEEESFALSLSQDIAAALARFRWFDVITPMSGGGAFASDNGLQSDLDYVVNGAVSRDGKHLRISARLLDLAQYARAVWTDRFMLKVGEVNRSTESITSRIAAQVDPVIVYIEGQPKRCERNGATGHLLAAIPLIYSMERDKYEEAGRLISQALEIDPGNAMIAAWAAYWHVFHVGQGWTQDVEGSLDAAHEHAVSAIRLDPDNAEAMGIYAHICAIFNRDFDAALHYFDRALQLNPCLAFIWAWSALTYCYVGDPDTALKRLERYRELAPYDPYSSVFENFFTVAYTFKGDYEEAVRVGRRAVRVSRQFTNGYKPLIASLGHLGRRDEAKPHVEKLLSLEPSFTVERFGRLEPFKHERDRERYMTGLRLAGVPER